MACEPGYIDMGNGECVYDFTSSVNADGTPKDGGDDSFWEKAGDVVTNNADTIIDILGGILGGGKKSDPSGTPPAPSAPPAKDRTLLYVGLGVVALVVVFLLVRRAAPAAMPVA